VEVTDRELLELAAKAAGISHAGYHEERGLRLPWHEGADDMDSGWWNPLTNDGDALRLLVALRKDLAIHAAKMLGCGNFVAWEANPNAFTRRAIVCAAAAMVQSLPATSSASSS